MGTDYMNRPLPNRLCAGVPGVDGKVAVYDLHAEKIVRVWPADAREMLILKTAVPPSEAPKVEDREPTLLDKARLEHHDFDQLDEDMLQRIIQKERLEIDIDGFDTLDEQRRAVAAVYFASDTPNE